MVDRIFVGIRDEEEMIRLRRTLKISGDALQYLSQDGTRRVCWRLLPARLISISYLNKIYGKCI